MVFLQISLEPRRLIAVHSGGHEVLFRMCEAAGALEYRTAPVQLARYEVRDILRRLGYHREALAPVDAVYHRIDAESLEYQTKQ